MRHTTIAVIVAAMLAPGAPAVSAQEMTDQQFVSLATTGGLAEVELGRLATERADLNAFAAGALPVLRQHLEMARSVNTQVVLGPVEPAQPAALPLGAVVGSPCCSGAYAPTGGTNFGSCAADKR